MSTATESDHQHVAEAILALPLRLRRVYVMAHVERLPRAEIASALGISPWRVERRLTRALAACRRMVEEAEQCGSQS